MFNQIKLNSFGEKIKLKPGTVMYTFKGGNKTAASPCPLCKGNGRKFFVFLCKGCDGIGSIMFQYRSF